MTSSPEELRSFGLAQVEALLQWERETKILPWPRKVIGADEVGDTGDDYRGRVLFPEDEEA